MTTRMIDEVLTNSTTEAMFLARFKIYSLLFFSGMDLAEDMRVDAARDRDTVRRNLFETVITDEDRIATDNAIKVCSLNQSVLNRKYVTLNREKGDEHGVTDRYNRGSADRRRDRRDI